MKNKLLIILGITLITFAGSVAFAQPGEGRQRNMKKVEQLGTIDIEQWVGKIKSADPTA